MPPPPPRPPLWRTLRPRLIFDDFRWAAKRSGLPASHQDLYVGDVVIWEEKPWIVVSTVHLAERAHSAGAEH